MPSGGLAKGDDGVLRCAWGAGSDDYRRYHDAEWGFPVADDTRLFEKICLEGFQAGLSWLTILRKREGFRRAFRGFEVEAVARFDRRRVERLVGNAEIVRHRGKIESVVNNAKRARELAAEYGSIAAYFWRYEPPAGERPKRATWAALRRITRSAASEAMSADLRRRGWTFVGPTTLYAFMQAMGLVNDHVEGCAVRPRVAAARRRFRPPR